MLYPKINSLWKRQNWYMDEGKKNNSEYQAGRQSFIVGDYADDSFGLVKQWRVEEKIDGMNIRVAAWPNYAIPLTDKRGKQVKFFGRSDKADIPVPLHDYLKKTFDDEALDKLDKAMPTMYHIILYGEGYGPKIQNGGNYRDDVGFILFDVWGCSRWSTREEVKQIAELLNLPTPYDYGLMTEEEIIALVKSKPNSPTAVRPMVMEGVICRSEPLLIKNSDNNPLIWKLKCKEF